MIALFAAPILLSAFLLFAVQPMVAKAILAWFGGSPAVWTTCMLFFQTLLLVGYAYAHAIASRLGARGQAGVHVALLALNVALLPIAIDPSWRPRGGEDDPVPRILGLLALSVGLPYVSLAATGPLLQAWARRAAPARNAYRLYAASNAGSLAALVSYPVWIEPRLAIGRQLAAWSIGYGAFALFAALAALRAARGAGGSAAVARDEPSAAAVVPWRVAAWILLPACASVLLLAVTNQLCQEVAVIPFLWVLPLTLYLLSFILTFDSDRWYRRAVVLPALLAATAAILAATFFGSVLSLPVAILVHAIYLVLACTACHGELVRLRPGPDRLTLFYLMLSLGGALGGTLVALVAPRVFRDYSELGVGIVACLVLCEATCVATDREGARRRRWLWLLWFELAIAAGGAWIGWSASASHEARVAERSFYGTLRVVDHREPGLARARELVHGRTSHGAQIGEPGRELEPTLYYGPHSGAGIVLGGGAGAPRRIAVLGLGVGTLAAYGRPGDTIRFFEIDPLVEALARREFTFLASSRAHIDVVVADARLALEHDPDGAGYDVIVADAFSSDAIPVHLLTAEAFALYARRLRPSGVLAIHISNRMLDLVPVVAAGAHAIGFTPVFVQSPSSPRDRITAALWALAARDVDPLAFAVVRDGVARVAAAPSREIAWTDEASSLFEILR